MQVFTNLPSRSLKRRCRKHHYCLFCLLTSLCKSCGGRLFTTKKINIYIYLQTHKDFPFFRHTQPVYSRNVQWCWAKRPLDVTKLLCHHNLTQTAFMCLPIEDLHSWCCHWLKKKIHISQCLEMSCKVSSNKGWVNVFTCGAHNGFYILTVGPEQEQTDGVLWWVVWGKILWRDPEKTGAFRSLKKRSRFRIYLLIEITLKTEKKLRWKTFCFFVFLITCYCHDFFKLWDQVQKTNWLQIVHSLPALN